MSSIATSDGEDLDTDDLGAAAIATESRHYVDSEWTACIATLRAFRHSVTCLEDDDIPPPSHQAIRAGVSWLNFLRQQMKDAPSLVSAEPGGGVVIEWQRNGRRGREILQITIYNSGTAEATEYVNGRVTRMNPIPLLPPDSLGYRRRF